ncbi:ferritin heavy chain-like [Glossophaga mutica]
MATAFASWPVGQNCHPECQIAIINQVDLEIYASYMYVSMACYFDRGDVALKHFNVFFLQQAKKVVDHAEYLLGLQSKHAGNIPMCNIPRPEEEHWESGLKVLESALHLAKSVHQSLLSLHQVATEKHGRVCPFVECEYLHEQVMFIQELGHHITNLRKVGTPEDSLAESLFEKLTLGDSKN